MPQRLILMLAFFASSTGHDGECFGKFVGSRMLTSYDLQICNMFVLVRGVTGCVKACLQRSRCGESTKGPTPHFCFGALCVVFEGCLGPKRKVPLQVGASTKVRPSEKQVLAIRPGRCIFEHFYQGVCVGVLETQMVCWSFLSETCCPLPRVGIRPLTFQVRILFVLSFCILATKSHSTKAKQKATAAKQQLLAKAGKKCGVPRGFPFQLSLPARVHW